MSQQINLVNPLLLKKRYAFGLREMALGMGLALAAVLGWSAWLYQQAGTLEARAAERETQQAAAQESLDRLAASAARPASALLAERARLAEARVAEREALLEKIGDTLQAASTGFSPRMRALALGRVEGVWLNEFTLAQDHVALRGSALEASLLTAYLDRLGRQAPFAGLGFSAMQAAAPAADDGPARIDFALTAGAPDNTGEGAADDR